MVSCMTCLASTASERGVETPTLSSSITIIVIAIATCMTPTCMTPTTYVLQSPDTFTAPCMRRYFHYTGQSLANRNNPVFQKIYICSIYRNPSISVMWHRVISSNQIIKREKDGQIMCVLSIGSNSILINLKKINLKKLNTLRKEKELMSG